jgi:hypothetical protein
MVNGQWSMGGLWRRSVIFLPESCSTGFLCCAALAQSLTARTPGREDISRKAAKERRTQRITDNRQLTTGDSPLASLRLCVNLASWRLVSPASAAQPFTIDHSRILIFAVLLKAA